MCNYIHELLNVFEDSAQREHTIYALSLMPSQVCANALTASVDNARVSLVRKCDPAKILVGQSESRSFIIVKNITISVSRQLSALVNYRGYRAYGGY